MKKILIFLGIPGSGKGTQAKKIVEKYGYVHFSTGNLLRSMAERTDLIKEQKELLYEVTQKGRLAPDSLIFELAFEAMDKIFAEKKGIVLDGAIRTIKQAGEYQKYFEKHHLENEVLAIEVAMADSESLIRLTNRRMCEKCGEIFSSVHHNITKCEKCGGELVKRGDDSVEVVKKRLEIQGNHAVEPIRNFYKQLGVLRVVDGTKKIDEVENEIQQILMEENYASKIA